jgi:hypothetical protein
MEKKELKTIIGETLYLIEDKTLREKVASQVEKLLNEINDESHLKNKLEILYGYEKTYLQLIKEYKEEIKFASALQEDIRRERAQFFAQTLRDVSDTMKKADVDSKVASEWIKELVNSYTNSLDVSSDLAKTNVIDVIGMIRDNSKTEVNTLNMKKEQ